MAHVARLAKQRRVVFPKEVVDHLGLEEGDMIVFKLNPGGRVTVVAGDVTPRR